MKRPTRRAIAIHADAIATIIDNDSIIDRYQGRISYEHHRDLLTMNWRIYDALRDLEVKSADVTPEELADLEETVLNLLKESARTVAALRRGLNL